MVLTIAIVGSQKHDWYPQYGAWLITLTFEIVVFGLSMARLNSSPIGVEPTVAGQNFLSFYRMFIILFQVIFPFHLMDITGEEDEGQVSHEKISGAQVDGSAESSYKNGNFRRSSSTESRSKKVFSGKKPHGASFSVKGGRPRSNSTNKQFSKSNPKKVKNNRGKKQDVGPAEGDRSNSNIADTEHPESSTTTSVNPTYAESDTSTKTAQAEPESVELPVPEDKKSKVDPTTKTSSSKEDVILNDFNLHPDAPEFIPQVQKDTSLSSDSLNTSLPQNETSSSKELPKQQPAVGFIKLPDRRQQAKSVPLTQSLKTIQEYWVDGGSTEPKTKSDTSGHVPNQNKSRKGL
jgi:hypothetical protein